MNRNKLIMITLLLVGLRWQASALELNQLQLHGFASQGYLLSNHYEYLGAKTDKGTVEFNEFGLNVMAKLTDRLRLGLQLLARDLGDSGNDKVTIDWAFADYRYRNWLGVRVGQFNRALGLYNQSRDIDAARTGVFLPLSVYYEGFRAIDKSVKGIELYGTLPGAFEYQMQYGTLDAGVKDGLLSFSPQTKSAEVADNAYVLHLKWNTPVDGLRLVGTFDQFSWSTVQTVNAADVTSKFDSTDSLIGIEYTWRNLTCAAEYSERKIKREQLDFTNEVYYGLFSYQFTDWFELATSYAVSYGNKDDKEGNTYAQQGQPKALAWRKDLAVSARFDLNEYWLVKLEGHWLNGLYGVSGYGSTPDDDGFLLAAKVTVSF